MFLKTVHSFTLPLICAAWLATTERPAPLRVPGQFPSIGAALAAARNGDRIIVADGVYSGPDNRNLDFAGKRIRLLSENGPTNCVIDCESQGRAFHFHNGEPPSVTLEGFTIQNGFVAATHGAGVLCESSSPTIRDCVFRWNTVKGVFRHGGGALSNLDGSATRILDCTFEENTVLGGEVTGGGAVIDDTGSRPTYTRCNFVSNRAWSAGGVGVVGADSRFRDCLFQGNVAESSGSGGLLCSEAGTIRLENCRFVQNLASGLGGGVLCIDRSSAQLDNCAFIGNVAWAGGGVGVYDLSTATVTRCTFTGNAADAGGGGGGLHVARHSSAVMEYTLCSGNSGTGDGGAAAVTGDADLTIRSCTLVGNEATFFDGHGFGGAICAWSARLTIVNSVLYTNSAVEGTAFGLLLPVQGYPDYLVLTVSSSVIQDGLSKRAVYIEDPNHPGIIVNWAPDNFDAAPQFRRSPTPGADGKWGTPDDDFGDLHLMPGSPCIDAGDPNYVARPGETDMDGDPRVLDGDADGIPVIDIGADEFVWP